MQYIKTTKIIKTGTSLCVVIPKEILHALKLNRGDQVAFGILGENTLAIRRVLPEEIKIINEQNF